MRRQRIQTGHRLSEAPCEFSGGGVRDGTVERRTSIDLDVPTRTQGVAIQVGPLKRDLASRARPLGHIQFNRFGWGAQEHFNGFLIHTGSQSRADLHIVLPQGGVIVLKGCGKRQCRVHAAISPIDVVGDGHAVGRGGVVKRQQRRAFALGPAPLKVQHGFRDGDQRDGAAAHRAVIQHQFHQKGGGDVHLNRWIWHVRGRIKRHRISLQDRPRNRGILLRQVVRDGRVSAQNDVVSFAHFLRRNSSIDDAAKAAAGLGVHGMRPCPCQKKGQREAPSAENFAPPKAVGRNKRKHDNSLSLIRRK